MNNKVQRFLTKDEELRLLNACEGLLGGELKAIVTIALDTGLRLSELLGLRWGDVDLKNRLIPVLQGKTHKPKASL